jgi:hypothetical protein
MWRLPESPLGVGKFERKRTSELSSHGRTSEPPRPLFFDFRLPFFLRASVRGILFFRLFFRCRTGTEALKPEFQK